MGDEPFCVYLGDNILTGGIGYMKEYFENSDLESLVALCEVDNPEKFGIAELDECGRILSIEEKPKEPKSNLAMIGIYFLRGSVFPVIEGLKPSWRNELEITEAIDGIRLQHGRVEAMRVKGWWKDTGKPEDILAANHLVLEGLEGDIQGELDPDVTIRGRVSVGEGTSILGGTVIRGPVVIGRDCVIGPDAYVGPYTAIGDGCTMVGGEIESSIVIENARIECGEKIVDSLIGGGSKISSSSDRLPKGYRFVIGENSQVIL
jgi:glucose-1-phosphate thymidylyltransferase